MNNKDAKSRSTDFDAAEFETTGRFADSVPSHATGGKGIRMNQRLVIPAEVETLATLVVDAAFAVHTELGPGLLESAYQACLAHELLLRGVPHQLELPVSLNYKGKRIEVGFRADIVIEQKLLIELKAVEKVLPIHKAQAITYLKLMRYPLGLLVNFNEVLIRDGIQRVLNLNWTQA